MQAFMGLGRALRWIRQRQDKKQYEVAEAANITKAMLSSYENEKQKPAIDTLERILDALGIDLDYLAYAIRVVRQEEARRSGARPMPTDQSSRTGIGPHHDLERTLGLEHRLEPAEEQAVGQMLEGFHALLRHMLGRTAELSRTPSRRSGEDTPAVGDDEE